MRTHTYWTTGEIEDLRYLKTYEKLSNKEIAEILGKTERTIAAYSCMHGIVILKPWEKQDEELLKKLVFNTSYQKKEIAKKLGRSEKAIKVKMREIFGSYSLTKLRNESFLNRLGSDFTENEIKFLQDFYYKKGGKECASILKRTVKSIKNKVASLKKQGVEFKKQIIPRFHPGAKGYVIFSQKTGKIIKRYNTLEEWARE